VNPTTTAASGRGAQFAAFTFRECRAMREHRPQRRKDSSHQGVVRAIRRPRTRSRVEGFAQTVKPLILAHGTHPGRGNVDGEEFPRFHCEMSRS
jgi:hypothetical protein